MYIKITDGTASRYTFRQLRQDNPHVSFPKEPNAATLAALGVFPVTQADPPAAIEGQVVERDAQPTDQGDGTYVWGWTVRSKTSAELDEDLTAWRNTAKLSRRDFCITLKRLGILSAGESIAAAKGDWPATFAGALSGLPQEAQDEAEIEWAAVQEIRRNHPMIALLGTSAGMTEAQVDSLFGHGL